MHMKLQKFIDEVRRSVAPHTIAAHFSNGLVPVAVLYLLFSIISRNGFFEHTVIHLLMIVLLAIPASFISGVIDWKRKYKAAEAPVFARKIRLSILLCLLAVSAVSIRMLNPAVMDEPGVLRWSYIVLIVAMLPVVGLLGYYGGKLSAGQRSERFR